MNATDSASPPPPPPPGAAPSRPPLTRASDDKIVSGLCGGLGRHLGIDPVVFRVAFVVLALAGGTGVLLYLIGWALVPEDRSGSALVHRLGGDSAPKLLAAVLAGVGLLVLFDGLTDDFAGDVPAGLILVGVGAAIIWSRRDGGQATTPAPPAPPEPPAPPGPPAPAPPPGAPEAPDPEAPTLTMPPPPPSPPPPPARHRSALVPVTLSLIAILVGALTLLDAADVIEVSLQAQLALALLLVGGALVLGAWRGRALWLIPVGLALSAGLVVAAVADVPLKGGLGQRTHRPATVAQLSSPYRLAAGRLTVDLRRVQPAGTQAVAASVGAGKLVVILPAGAEITVDARVGGGELDVMGQHWEGLDVSRRARVPGQEGQGRFRLETQVGYGTLEVRRAPA